MTPEALAQLFHETYERLAPSFGYETRKETAVSWQDIPADNPNKRLMIAVAGEVLEYLREAYSPATPRQLYRAAAKLREASLNVTITGPVEGEEA